MDIYIVCCDEGHKLIDPRVWFDDDDDDDCRVTGNAVLSLSVFEAISGSLLLGTKCDDDMGTMVE